MTSTFIIAEAGVNHGGSVEAAFTLVDAAAQAGADAVKFQSFRTDLLVRPDARQAEYQSRNAAAESQAAMLRPLELSEEAHRRIAERCKTAGITFLSTAFDPPSLELLLDLGVPRLKVASGELTNGPMLLEMARSGLPLIVSTGMADLSEIADALAVIAVGRSDPAGNPTTSVLREARRSVLADPSVVDDVTLLHCTSRYPAPDSSVNLRSMNVIAEAFGLPVGYSDHTTGLPVPLAATALGATVIEKHLTLDRSMPGPDHLASADPTQFAALVEGVRSIERALGRWEKEPDPGEHELRRVARRGLVTTRDLTPSRPIQSGDLTALRPADGLPPSSVWELIGRSPSRTYAEGETFEG